MASSNSDTETGTNSDLHENHNDDVNGNVSTENGTLDIMETSAPAPAPQDGGDPSKPPSSKEVEVDEPAVKPLIYKNVPEEVAWFPSQLTFAWERPLFRRASQLHKVGRALEHEDLLPLPKMDHGEQIVTLFENKWNQLQQQQQQQQLLLQQSSTTATKDSTKIGGTGKPTTGIANGSNDSTPPTSPTKGQSHLHPHKNVKSDPNDTKLLTRTLFHVMGSRFIIAGLIKIINTGLQFCFPILLNALLKFIEQSQAGMFTPEDPWQVKYRGYWLSVLLMVTMASKTITENAYFHRMFRVGWQARIAVSMAVYNKSLRLTNAERQSTTLGELVNLMQIDASKIEMFIPQFHVLWDGMLQIVGYMTILYTFIGWPCFAGLGVMIVAGPIQGIVMGKLFGANRSMVKFTDSRVESTNEALQGIQCVKMYTWEQSFAETIAKYRSKELACLKETAYLRGFARAYMSALPGLVAVLSFVVYALWTSGAEIDASTLFAALVAFDQLRFPLMFYPMALAQLVQAKVSAGRVQTFLGLKEVGKGEAIGGGIYHRIEEEPDGGNSGGGEIIIQNAEVYWNDPDVPLEGGGPPSDGDDSSSVGSSTGKEDESSTSFAPSTNGGGGDNSSNGSVSRRLSKTIPENSVLTNEDIESSSDIGLIYPKPTLKNITMKVSNGELCAVVGRVASGKSTLCSAILNETFLKQGEVTLKGKVAYAAQTPWILNATLRENILFGRPMDEERYKKVLKACQLEHDLYMLEDGDLTDIGERGINLSGGQKARVSVARAAYADADTIILDDPLSALDPEVAKKLFSECIVDLMQGKTRLLVTNQIQFLSSCDTVIALRRGEIIEQGSYDDLVANGRSEVNRLLNESSTGKSKRRISVKTEDEKSPKGQTPAEEAAAAPLVFKDKKELVTKEERNIGAVSFSVYFKYIKAGGGILRFIWVYFGFLLCAGNGLATTSWISYWTADGSYQNHSKAFYLGIYFFLAGTLGLFTFLRAFTLARFGVQAAENLHNNLLRSVLQAPQSFFDTTPLGRILSRFSKDIYTIDLELSDFLDWFLFCTLNVVMSIGTIMFVTPWFGVAVPPLAYAYFRIMNYFRDVARETKRLESISRSPVFAHFSETLGGLSTIRAYGEPERFRDEFEGKIDGNTKAYYNNRAADRWLSVRLEFIGASIGGLAAIFATNVAISNSVSGQPSSSNFASLAGLSLTFAISMTGLLQFTVRSFAQLESGMNAAERVIYYTEEIPQEAPFTSEELEAASAKAGDPPSSSTPSTFAVVAKGGKVDKFPPEWPEKGEIVLHNLRMRYRSDTPLVLKGLNVTITGGERVGVVGRTGSGKSSLLLTLLRLVEPSLLDDPEKYEAPISIDGVDTLRIGLRELRSKMAIIPQNPVLFSGTVKSNIDPFNQFTEEQIWDALEKCGLKVAVESMPGQLGAAVAEYGQNLSSGMRQMLVLGRALLRQCRVLLLDEATSSVDFETDQEIQRTLREAFAGCTVITIAHRINTIMDSDKILVMKDGLAAEYAPPQELLQDENSIFSEIVRHAESDEH